MDTQTQIDRLIELAIIQRTELKQLVEQLPQLREHLNAEVERTFEEAEPQIRTELEEFVMRQAADKTATLGTALEAKIGELAKSLEESAQAKYSALIATRDQNATLLAQAEERIAAAAGELPAKVKDIVAAELARFPRAGEIDQLRKEFAEPRGLNPRGKWQAGETYNKLDLVTINGDSYTSNTDNNITRPTRSSSDWTLVAARGTGGGGGPTSLSELTTVPSNGDILIGSGTSWVTSNLTAGAGISITVGAGEITISATDGDITLDDGTAASPSLHFTNDADTGLYRPAANTLGISVSGTQVAYFDTNGLTIPSAGVVAGGSFHGANGNANNPTFSFQSDQDTGMFRHGTNELGFTVGGTEKAVLTSTTFTVTPNFVGSGSGTFGGNLTVSGTGNLGGGTAYTTGVTVKPATNDYQVTLLQSNSNSAGWGLLADTSGNLKLTRYGASVYGTAALTFDLNGAATFNSSTTTTVGGNLTVSGITSTFGPASAYARVSANTGSNLELFTPSAGTSVLIRAGSATIATFADSGLTTLAGNLTVSGTGTGDGVSYNILAGGSKRIYIGYNTTGDYGAINVAETGVTWKNLVLNQSGGDVLFGTVINGGNGKIQLATHTTSAGGIGFGTDTSLFRTAAGEVGLDALSGTATVFGLRIAGTRKSYLYWENGTSTLTLAAEPASSSLKFLSANALALTLDSSQNATFANEIRGTGNLVAVATSGTNGNVYLRAKGTGYVRVDTGSGFRVETGKVSFTSLPTSSAGLSAGDIWNDGGTLKIV